MEKAQAAYAEGKYADCEAYAKRAVEVDPNEVAATMLVFKAGPSGTTSKTSRPRRPRRKGR